MNLISVSVEVFTYPAISVPQHYPALPENVAQIVVGLIVRAYHWKLRSLLWAPGAKGLSGIGDQR